MFMFLLIYRVWFADQGYFVSLWPSTPASPGKMEIQSFCGSDGAGCAASTA
jgi:hypothetical protein